MSSLLVTCWDDENFRCQVFLWLRVKYCQVFLGYCQVFLGLCAMWWNSVNVTFSFELMGCDDSEAVKFSCDLVRHLDCQTVQLGVTWVKWWHAKQSWGLMCWSDQQECQVFLWLAVIEWDEKNFKFLYSLYYIHTLDWCSDMMRISKLSAALSKVVRWQECKQQFPEGLCYRLVWWEYPIFQYYFASEVPHARWRRTGSAVIWDWAVL